MEYRKENGLPSIPLSPSLTLVAQQHAKDLVIYKPDTGKCNMHSWSVHGKWTPCCYTKNHAQAKCMWFKPRELTTYQGYGYEIACGSSVDLDAITALSSWKSSPGHNAVILNKDIWSDHLWKAIGVGIYKNRAVVWFGEEPDR